MKKLLVEGLGRSGSQWDIMAGHHMLEFQRLLGFEVNRRSPAADAPEGVDRTLLAFSAAQREVLAAVGDIAGAEPDVVYRVDGLAPLTEPPPKARTFSFVAAARSLPASSRQAADLAQDGNSIVVPSTWSRDLLLANGLRPETIAVVPLGVDAEQFAPLSWAERNAVRARLGLREEDLVLLNVAAPGDDDGLDVLLRAFARQRGKGTRVRLVLRADRTAGEPDYEATIRWAALDTPALLRPEILAAITTVPGPLGRDEERLLYGAADCYVSPYRASAFNSPVLQAIASGLPVIVTRGGATDDICDDTVAWRIAGRLREKTGAAEAGLARSIEPDLDELTDAIGEIALGRGFDRLRFAQGRTGLLARSTWTTSALALAALTGSASSPPVEDAINIVTGLVQPAQGTFAARRFASLPTRRRFTQRQPERARSDCLSVVVQGPCLRKAGAGVPSIDQVLASIRSTFPKAQVVVSTWVGSDVDGLDADDIVLSNDPGPLEHPGHRTNNVNRMITTTANGLAAAARTFCVKTRTDVMFRSNGLVCRDLNPAADRLSLERRIWASAARLATSLRPLHPCDMVQFGLTDDLRRLWDAGSFSHHDLFLPEPYSHLPRMAAEQCVFVGYLRGLGLDISLESTFDGRAEIIAASLTHMLGAFDVYDADEAGVWLTARFRENQLRPRLYDTHESFEALRSAFLTDPNAACARAHQAFHATLESLGAQRSA